MTIQNPIIDAGPTAPRSEIKTVLGRTSYVAPPDFYNKTEGGQVVTVSQEAEREGQLIFVVSADGLSASPYIVVKILGGVLVWRRIFTAGVTQDPRTGKPKDPLYDYA